MDTAFTVTKLGLSLRPYGDYQHAGRMIFFSLLAVAGLSLLC